MDADEEKHILYEKNEVIIQNLGVFQACFCVRVCVVKAFFFWNELWYYFCSH